MSPLPPDPGSSSASGADNRDRARIARRLQSGSGRLSTAATARMENDLPWVADLPAEDRSFIGLILQAGIKSFVDWYRESDHRTPLRAEVFGVAPPALAGDITLAQTVAMVRLSVDVVDENLDDLLGADADDVRTALNQYARELAFATAEVYARAAEQRGAWDARLEALVTDALLRGDSDEAIMSRASALGWRGSGHVVVLAGAFGSGADLDGVRRAARERHLDCLCAVEGDRLLVVLGGVDRMGRPAGAVAEAYAAGPVVIGPVVAALPEARLSADDARSSLRVVAGWSDTPRPVHARDLLPERALVGDARARAALVDEVHRPLVDAGGSLQETAETFVGHGASIQGTARELYVHANTVRYRLKRVAEITGLEPTNPRDAYVLRIALSLGRLHDFTEDLL